MAGDLTREYAAAYLAGFIDGEGSVSRVDLGKARVVAMSNTDPHLVAFVQECIEKLGVDYSIATHGHSRERCAPVTVIRVGGRENIARLASLVELHSRGKQHRLRDLFLRGWSRVRPHRDDIARMYGQGMSIDEIATHYEVPFSTARKWMVDMGIERRTTGGGKATSRARKKALSLT